MGNPLQVSPVLFMILHFAFYEIQTSDFHPFASTSALMATIDTFAAKTESVDR